MIFKKIPLIILTFVIMFGQLSYAQTNNNVDALTSIHNGLLTYTEISKNTYTEIKVNLNSGNIFITVNNQQDKSTTYSFDFDPEKFNISPKIIAQNTEYPQPNTKSVFNNQQTKGCGSAAGALLDLANRMITEGHATGNQALVTYGRILRDIAARMFQTCMQS